MAKAKSSFADRLYAEGAPPDEIDDRTNEGPIMAGIRQGWQNVKDNLGLTSQASAEPAQVTRLSADAGINDIGRARGGRVHKDFRSLKKATLKGKR